jgi:hypothetical protein
MHAHHCDHQVKIMMKRWHTSCRLACWWIAWRESLNHKLQVLVQVVPCCLLLNQNHWENQMTFCFMSGFCFNLFSEKRTDCYIVFISQLHCLHQNPILSFHICTTMHSVSGQNIYFNFEKYYMIRLDDQSSTKQMRYDMISSACQIISPFV